MKKVLKLTLFGFLPGVLLLAAAFAHPFASFSDRDLFIFVLLVVTAFAVWQRAVFLDAADVVLLYLSAVLLGYVFLSAQLELPPTPVKHLRSYLKVYYALGLIVLFVLYRKRESRYVIILVTALFASNLLLLWHDQGVTLRSFPLAVYVIGGYALCIGRDGAVFQLNWRDLAPLGLVLALLVSLLFSPVPLGGVHTLVGALCGLGIFWIARIHLNGRSESRPIFVVFVSQLLVMLVFYAVGSNPAPGAKYRLFADFNPNVVGGFAGIFFPVVFWRAMASGKPALAWLSVAAPAAIGVLLASQARAAMLACLAGMVAPFVLRAVVFDTKSGTRRGRWWLLLGVVVTLAVGVFAVIHALGPTSSLASVRARQLLWQVYLNSSFHSPWVGFGPDAYSLAYSVGPAGFSAGQSAAILTFAQGFGVHAHAHNLLLQTLFDLGMFGVFALSIVALCIASSIYRAGREHGDPRAPELAAFFAALCVHGLAEFPFAFSTLLIPACYFVGLAFALPGGRAAFGMSHRRILWILGAGMLLVAVFGGLYAVNLNLSQRARRALTGHFSADRNGHVLVQGPLTPALSRRLMEIESRYLPNPFDWRLEQLRGAMVEAAVASGRTEALPVAAARYEACLRLHQASGFCARKLGHIRALQGRKAESEHYLLLAKKLDPWGLGL